MTVVMVVLFALVAWRFTRQLGAGLVATALVVTCLVGAVVVAMSVPVPCGRCCVVEPGQLRC